MKIIKETHAFARKSMVFPVVVIVRNETQKEHIKYLKKAFKTTDMTTEDVCKWCIRHGNIEYRVALRRFDRFRPLKRRRYKLILKSLQRGTR